MQPAKKLRMDKTGRMQDWLAIILIITMLSRVLWRYRAWLHFQGSAPDHYSILGLPRTATISQVKKKYYELAKIYHPDVNPQKDAQAKFMQISKAYEILCDVTKRTEYDGSHRNPSEGLKPEGDEGFQARARSKKQHWRHDEEFDPFNAYDEYFKKNRAFSKPRRGEDVNINISVSFEESINGARKEARYSQKQSCEYCSDLQMPLCLSCGGKKTIFNRAKRQKENCQKCQGRGYQNSCKHCEGNLFVTREVVETVHISKNTHHKSILRLEGLGHHGFKSRNGDLYVTVFVEESEHFKVDGNNVRSEHRLDYITAACGGTTRVRTVYGEQQVEIKAGTQSGEEVRLFNKGLTSPYSKRRGDQVVTFRIKVPARLSKKQKDLLQELQVDL